MAENIKNLCAPIPAELHAQLRQRQEESGQTLSQYMTWLITKFYESEGKTTMKENRRTCQCSRRRGYGAGSTP